MVYVNSKKFACESCIKGHRSSSCHHTDRPLFEIKKKGRPVSQCTKCRELRQSKKFHSKCTCNHMMEEVQAVQPLASSSNSKTRRFIPIVPALPNGLRDVLAASESPMPLPDSRQRVDSLLNPCECKSLWKCKCREAKSSRSSGPDLQIPESTDGLFTLARAAAAMSCCTPSSSTVAISQFNTTSHKTAHRPRSRPGSPARYSSNKRQKHDVTYPAHAPGPDLAPLLYLSSPSSPSITTPMPDFPSMPPMSEITSLAGSGCTCGVKCACPGCVEHRRSEHTNQERRDCADGCGTCIDHSIGMELPDGNKSQTGTSFLDRFFARAAALPPPPIHHKMPSYHLDPMDTTVFSPVVRPLGSQPFPFGSVKLPKLECCGGQCNCPSDQCTCRVSCAGCCADTADDRQSAEILVPESSSTLVHITSPTQHPNNCCA